MNLVLGANLAQLENFTHWSGLVSSYGLTANRGSSLLAVPGSLVVGALLSVIARTAEASWLTVVRDHLVHRVGRLPL